MNNIEQANNVRVVHFLEQRNFADSCRGDTLIFGFETNLLERDNALVRMGEVASLVDDSVCACMMCEYLRRDFSNVYVTNPPQSSPS